MSERVTERPGTGRLGVVLLDLPHYAAPFAGCCEPGDQAGLGSLPRGFFECPATWPVPTAFAVAPGASAEDTLGANAAVGKGLLEALERLHGHCEVAITDCGFFWAALPALENVSEPPILSSGLELLGLAARVTKRPIGVLTFSAPALEPLLAGHPERDRLRIVGFNDLPQWAAFDCEDYATNGRWSLPELRREFLGRLSQELSGGRLARVGALVIECTLMPQFRHEIRQIMNLAVFDVGSCALAKLGGAAIEARNGRAATTGQ